MLAMLATFVTLVLISPFASAADAPAALPTGRGEIVPADWADLHQRWAEALAEAAIPGAAVAVVRGDEVVLLAAFGHCDAAAMQPVNVRSPFYLASVTKSFTALGIAILADEGKLKLDEPVRTYLPRFELADPELSARLTLRDLLAHRQGIDSIPIGLAEAYFGNITEDRYYRLLPRERGMGKFNYTNLHYTLLGRVIEAVSGRHWKDFLAERVFTPLGMADATCYASQLYANPLAAQPLVLSPQGAVPAPLRKTDSVMHAAGGMGASVSDLAAWLRLHLSGRSADGTSLLSPAMLREVQTRQVEFPAERSAPGQLVRDGYSLGWFTGTLDGRRHLDHGGGYVGTATQVSLLPDDGVGVAVVVNDSRPLFSWLVIHDVYARLLNLEHVDLLPELRTGTARLRERVAKRAEAEWDPPALGHGLTLPLADYAGSYENPIWGDVTVGEADGRLTLRFGELPARLHTLGDNRFRYEAPPGEAFAGEFQLRGRDVTGFRAHTPLGKAEFTRRAKPATPSPGK